MSDKHENEPSAVEPEQERADGAASSARLRDDERSLLSGLVKKAVSTGINTIMNTEEGVRAVVGAVAQRDIIGSAVSGVDATRKEAVALVGREIASFLDSLNLSEEIAKILTSVSFEIRTEVRFIPNKDGKLRAKVTTGARPKVKFRQEPEEEPPPAGGVDGTNEADQAPEKRGGQDRRAYVATRAVRDLVERLAEVTAATARAAAEVAAETAADVVNEVLSDGEKRTGTPLKNGVDRG